MGRNASFFRNGGFFVGTTPHWLPERDMPDQTGRVAVVSGATAGLGYETCRQLLAKGATVYALARSDDKGTKCVESLRAEKTHKGDARYAVCDLADLATVRKCATDLLEKEQKIHTVYANAGIMIFSEGPDTPKVTAQNHEVQFGTNVLGHHFLLQLLKPALVHAAESAEKAGSVRIVILSSSGHTLLPTKKMLQNWDPSDAGAKEYGPQPLYGRSKLGNLHTVQRLADELESKGVVVVGVHPGNIRTELQRHSSSIQKRVISMLLYPVQLGAVSQLFAGTADEDTKKLQRAYLVPWAYYGDMNPAATDKTLVDKTWAWCEEQTKDF